MDSSRIITPRFGTLAIQLVLVMLVAWARSSSAIGISRSVSSRISRIPTDQPGGAMWAVRMDRGDKFLPEIGLTLRHGHIPNGHLEVESVTVNGAASEAGVTVGDVISDPVPETALVKAIESAAESRLSLIHI